MTTAVSRTRKLNFFVKCDRCRKDRQKVLSLTSIKDSRLMSIQCERQDASQKCLWCTRYKHESDPGRLSNRARRSQKQSVGQRASTNKRLAVAPDTTQYKLLTTHRYSVSDGDCDKPSLYVKESSSQMSRSASERSMSLSTPGAQRCLLSQQSESRCIRDGNVR